MKYYFTLQYRRTIRLLEALGIQPLLAGFLCLVAFIGGSKFLFYKTETANWIYCFLTLGTLLSLGNKERNDPLKSIFNKQEYLGIRILENGLVTIPFIIYLCYEKAFFFALGLIPISIGLALFTNLPKIKRTIPTPFRKFPFEFIVGFRKTALFVFLVYLLAIKAIEVDNYNLGIFSLAILFFTSMSFYSKPEEEYYCWIFAMGPKDFLLKKVKDGLICSSILMLPLFIGLIGFYPDKIWITIAIQFLGYIYIISMILAKYSSFPGGMNIVHGIFYGTSIIFPPLLMVIIPIFYIQAKRRLTTILGW